MPRERCEMRNKYVQKRGNKIFIQNAFKPV